ncbi:uncharacterized protein LOC142352206 [Convolutriloba macropyga]|uniref:uncharacterized protein LOC142352206 n=1 Tax=Convolutriloba macropyga TaxID=536237 RepID=UPI003F5276E3
MDGSSRLFDVDSLRMNDADFLLNFLYYRMMDPTANAESRAKATKQCRNYLGLRLTYDVYKRLTSQEEKDKLEGELIAKVADFVKRNPKCSDDEKAAFIKQELQKYAEASKKL